MMATLNKRAALQQARSAGSVPVSPLKPVDDRTVQRDLVKTSQGGEISLRRLARFPHRGEKIWWAL